MDSTSEISTFDVPAASERNEGQNGILRRHKEYYIPSGDVVFKVEDTLFRVHKYFFERESAIFRDMLSLPVPAQGSLPALLNTSADQHTAAQRREGTSDDDPIHLPQVSSKEFEQFLWVFYNPTYSEYDAPSSTWTSILRLAHLWDFRHVSELAFEKLRSEPPAKRLALAERYDGPSDLRTEAMSELVTRYEPLSLVEGEELGMETTLKIARMRERARAGGHGRSFRGRRTDGPGDYYRNPHPHVVVMESSRSRSRSPAIPPPPPTPPPVVIAPPQPPPFIIPPPFIPPPAWHNTPPESPVAESIDGSDRTSRRRRVMRFFKNMLRR